MKTPAFVGSSTSVVTARTSWGVVVWLMALVVAGCSGGGGGERGAVESADPPEVAIGERLFLETRFAEHFATESGERVNAPLAHRDTTLVSPSPPASRFPAPSGAAR